MKQAKRIFWNPWMGVALFLGVFFLMSTVNPTSTRYNTSTNKAQHYTWVFDTITDTGADTLNITDTQTSNWYGMLQVDGKKLTGTMLVDVQVERSNFVSPDADQWAVETRDTLNGTTEQIFIDLGRMESFRYRVILTGTGTQTAEYEAVMNLKKD